MAHARGRERRRDIAVDPVAEADEDPGGQARLRLREDRGQRVAGARRTRSSQRPWVVRGGDHAEGARVERAPSPEPLEIRPVVRVGARPEATLDDDDVRRLDRSGSVAASRPVGTPRRRPRPFAGSRPGRHRAATRRTRPASSMVRSPSGVPARDAVVPRTSRPATSAIPIGDGEHGDPPRPGRHRDGETTRSRRRPSGRSAGAAGRGPATAAPRPWHRPRATRCGACQPDRHKGVAACPASWRRRSPGSGARRRSRMASRPGASRIFWTVTGPTPGSASSWSAVAWLRSTGPVAAPAPAGPLAVGPPAVGPVDPGASSRDGTRTRSPSLRVAARLSCSLRPGGVDPGTVAAGRREQVADPRPDGQPEDARVGDRPDDLDHDDPAARRRAQPHPGSCSRHDAERDRPEPRRDLLPRPSRRRRAGADRGARERREPHGRHVTPRLAGCRSTTSRPSRSSSTTARPGSRPLHGGGSVDEVFAEIAEALEQVPA